MVALKQPQLSISSDLNTGKVFTVSGSATLAILWHGNLNPETTAFTHFTFNPNFTVHLLNQIFGDNETNTDSVYPIILSNAFEWLKQILLLLVCLSISLINNINTKIIIIHDFTV